MASLIARCASWIDFWASALGVRMAAAAGLICVFLLSIWLFTHRQRGRRTTDSYPDVLMAPNVEHVYVTTASGCKVHAIELSRPGTQLQNTANSRLPLMLCLHGYPESPWSYRYVMAAFSPHYRVLAIDMPGYGETGALQGLASWTDARQYRIAAVVQVVLETVKELGYSKFVLVGHDWGGVIAWHVAFARPDLVEKLIVMSCPHPRAMRQNWSLAQSLRSYYIFLFNIPWLPEWVTTRSDGRVVRRATAGRKLGVSTTQHGPYELRPRDLDAAVWSVTRNPSGPLNYYRNTIDGGNADAPRSSSAKNPLNVPVLLLWGSKDTFLGPELTRGTHRFCAPGRFKLHIYEGCSHWMQQEPAFIERLLADFAEFLELGPVDYSTMRAVLGSS